MKSSSIPSGRGRVENEISTHPADERYSGSRRAGRSVGTLAWSRRERCAYFEYASSFFTDALPLSPFHLKTGNGLIAASRDPFDALHGAFNDSLPDGWGRLLLDRRLQRAGIDYNTLTPLDRLLLWARVEWVRFLTFLRFRMIRRSHLRSRIWIGSSSRWILFTLEWTWPISILYRVLRVALPELAPRL